MNRKKTKLNRMLGLLRPESSASGTEVEKELSALKSYGNVLNLDILREYMEEQQRQAMLLEEQLAATAEKENPFANLPDEIIAELTEHKNRFIAQGAKLELARRNFFYFCHLKNPDFYRLDRDFLVTLCDELQDFYESDETVMVVNLPPRHGKSYTAAHLEQWIFGKNQKEKIMTGSYNETLSTTFSKNVRNGIGEEKADPDKIVYSDIFPGVRIQRGDGAMNLWSLEGQYASYLATSPGGTATGFGASLIVVDDLIKLAIEAFNDNLLEAQWRWFTDTMLSRLENGGKIIIIMTRWASGDLAGLIVKHFAEEGTPCRVLSMKALVNEERKEMLCPSILSYKDYRMKVRLMSEEIASANFNQNPVDLKGRLYQSFKTYTDIPRSDSGRPLFTAIKAYCDTADTGSDYLCNIIYGVYQNEAYVLDVYYTKAAMEVTELETAKRLYELEVRVADFESNNGGRGYARNVESILKNKHRSNRCKVKWFHQGQNKRARILTNSTWVQDHIYFPVNWKDRWPEYHAAMFKYQKEGKNAHDDAPDATTGVAEKISHRGGVTFLT
ncbi:MAG: phage terminase large subunit [Oscillospiraceae bacterium]